MFEEKEQHIEQQGGTQTPQDIFQEQNPTPETVAFSESEHEHSFLSKKTIFIILGIIFALILVAVGVQVALNVFKQKPAEQAVVQPPIVPSPTQEQQKVQPTQQPANQTQPQAPSGGGDDDKDGLTNQEEEQLGTSKDNVDSDTDGLSDREEVRVFKSNPLNPDTDGDGYTDGEEVKNGYNPNGPGKIRVVPVQ